VQGPRATRNQAENEGGEAPALPHLDLAGAGEGQGNHAQQVQADEKEDRGNEIVAVAADVAQHPPGHRGGGADEPDGDQDAQREQQGNLESALRGVDPCSSMKRRSTGCWRDGRG
jgi:hypothetical protein